MIFIREKDDIMKEAGAGMQELVVRALSAAPAAVSYREYFSFLREIFYYSSDMDQVDFDLACDTLHTFNQVLKISSQFQVSEKIKVNYSSIDHVNIQDYFLFSESTPGVILSERFVIP